MHSLKKAFAWGLLAFGLLASARAASPTNLPSVTSGLALARKLEQAASSNPSRATLITQIKRIKNVQNPAACQSENLLIASTLKSFLEKGGQWSKIPASPDNPRPAWEVLREDALSCGESLSRSRKKNPDVQGLLGLLYRFDGQTFKASSQFKAALKLSPGKAPYQAALKDARKQLSLEKSLTRFSFEKADLFLSEENKDALPAFEQAFDQAYNELARLFKTEPCGRVSIKVFPNYEAVAQSDAWAGSFSGRFAAYDITLLMSEEQLNGFTGLKHEMIHWFVASLSGSKCPAWLDEGLATLLSGELDLWQGEYRQTLVKLAHQKPSTFAQLESFLNANYEIASPEARQAYAQSAACAHFLIERYSIDKLVLLLKKINRKAKLDAAFNAALGISVSGFENEWFRSLVVPQSDRIAKSAPAGA